MTEKEQSVLDIISSYGNIDGAHHKQWVLDQIIRIITEDTYKNWVDNHNYPNGKDNEQEYEWDTGIAP